MVKKKLDNNATLPSLIMVVCIQSGFCMEIKLLTNRKYCSKQWNRYVCENKFKKQEKDNCKPLANAV